MADLDRTFNALADPTRRGVIDLLSQRPHRAGELAEAFDMSPPAMSRHLRILRTHGLIEDLRTDEDARQRLFRLRREPFVHLSEWIGDVQTFWDEQLNAFQSHVAKKRKQRK